MHIVCIITTKLTTVMNRGGCRLPVSQQCGVMVRGLLQTAASSKDPGTAKLGWYAQMGNIAEPPASQI